jgi:hypothetical protein
MSISLKWVWELTPHQVFQKNRFIKSSGSRKLFQEVRGFAGPQHPLTGSEYTYQLCLSKIGKTEESILLSQEHPDIPDSGDSRSGVLIFDSDKIVASLILSGVDVKQPFKMVVNADYRDQGLAERLLVEWWSSVKHTYRDSGDQAMNVLAVKVLLNAYRVVVGNTMDQPASHVASNVQEEYENGTEAAEVLAVAQAVEDEGK